MNKKLLVLGDSEFREMVFEIASCYFTEFDFLDDNFEDAIGLFGEYKYAIPVFADGALREKWHYRLKEWAYTIPALIHKTAVIDLNAT